MNKYVYIYSLEDQFGNIRYIGKANDLKRRLKGHIEKIDQHTSHKNSWIKGLLNQGIKPILKEVDQVLENEWKFWESYYIYLFKSWGFNLTNMTFGGDGLSNPTNEVRDKISNSLKETYKNGYKTWNKGIKTGLTPWNKGIKQSDEAKRKVSKKLKESFKNGRVTWNKGKKLNEQERKELMYRHPNRRDVLQFDLEGNFIAEYPSSQEAIRRIGIKADIGRCCKGKVKSAGGYLWLLKEDHEENPNLIKERVSLANKPKKIWNKGLKGVIKMSDETKRKMSEMRTGKEIKKQDKVICPYCGKNGGLNAMTRYHFDNCKYKKD